MSSTSYNHRKGSTFRSAMIRSAESRKCPKCGRKSAVFRDAALRESYCRWNDCDYWVEWNDQPAIRITDDSA